MIKGYFVPVLHSHLPFVKHPEYGYFLEEHWFFEAIVESYIPLLMNLKKLEDEGVPFRLTVSVTPPLAEMMNDTHLQEKFLSYIDRLLELCSKEKVRLQGDERFYPIACYYDERLHRIKDFYTGFLNYNLLNGYRHFAATGVLEIITCTATHGFLPLLSENPEAVEVQIKLAVQAHTYHFGRPPQGIWLAECAYYEGVDEVLARHGIRFFFLEAHGLIYGKPTPKYGVFAPVYTPSGVAVFGRDPESSKQVWSSKEGYPGDVHYRDFYKDIGYELDHDYIAPYICPDGTRVFTGLKYWRVTGPSDWKEPYDAVAAFEKTKEHAANFHFNRAKQFEHLSAHMDRTPMVVSPYDAELFGHWWFEGPDFLYHLFKEIDKHQVFKAATPPEILRLYSTNQVIRPTPSSWGDGGYYDVWLNSGNDWIYRHLHHMASKMVELARLYQFTNDGLKIRLLNQMARELLLAQSSDWAFLMTTRTAVEYSVKRTREHIANFNKLAEMVEGEEEVDRDFLAQLERRDSIFPFLDFRIYV